MSHHAALDIARSSIGLLIGLFIAFAGYRLARGFAAIAGFFIGFSIGLLLGLPGGPLISLLAAVLVGILVALLFRFAFRLVGGALGAGVGSAIATSLAWPVWALVLAIVVGIGLGLWLNKPVIIGATGVLGAWLATRSTFELLHDAGVTLPWDREIMGIVITVVFAGLGILSQWRAVRTDD